MSRNGDGPKFLVLRRRCQRELQQARSFTFAIVFGNGAQLIALKGPQPIFSAGRVLFNQLAYEAPAREGFAGGVDADIADISLQNTPATEH